MKKQIVLIFVFLIILTQVNALGLFPSTKNIKYVPSSINEIKLTIVNSEAKDLQLKIYPKGDLAQYVELSTNTIKLSRFDERYTITYKLNLPESLEKSSNILQMVVEEQPSSSSLGTITGLVSVIQKVVVNVPTAGKYMQVKFSSNNPDSKEDISLSYYLSNEGNELIKDISASVVLLDSKLNFVANAEYKFDPLAKGEARKELRVLANNMVSGVYYAKTKVTYDGKTIDEEIPIIVGRPYIDIQGISADNFKLGQINKIDFLIYNKWFEAIDNIAGDISVIDSAGNMRGDFKTISVNLLGFSGTKIYGYWDTANTASGIYTLIANLKYGGKSTQKEFQVQVTEDRLIAITKTTGNVVASTKKVNSDLSVLIAMFLILIILNVILILYIRKKNMQN